MTKDELEAGRMDCGKRHTILIGFGWRWYAGLMAGLMLLLSSVNGDPRAQEIPRQADPDRPWIAEADGLLRDGRIEAAQKQYQRLSVEHSDDFAIWLRLSYVDLQLHRVDAALHSAQTAFDLAPDETDAFLMLAQCQVQSGDPRQGLETLSVGLKSHPQERRILESMVSISIGLHDWPQAVGLLRELVRQHPQHASYHVDLGRILLSTGDVASAVGEFSRAQELGAEPALCTALRGKAHLGTGELDAAEREFRQSLSIRPNGDAYGGLATIHFLRGERGKAIQSFRQALEQSPDDADLHYNLGNVLAQVDRLDEAEEEYRRSLRLDPSSATTHLNLGVLLLNRFAVSEAEQHLRLAVQFDPSLPAPYLHLGRIAGATYDYETAIRDYQSYQERLGDAVERQRIDSVLRQLRARQQASEDARQKGEMHLLQLMVESEAEARAVIDEVRRGADFYVVAERKSQLASVAGVDAGFLDPGALSPLFRDAVSALARGEMTPPLRASNGYYVFKRVE